MENGQVNYTLTNSAAILRYLADSRQTERSFYPKENKARAQVENYLNINHSYICASVSGLVYIKVFAPLLGGK